MLEGVEDFVAFVLVSELGTGTEHVSGRITSRRASDEETNHSDCGRGVCFLLRKLTRSRLDEEITGQNAYLS